MEGVEKFRLFLDGHCSPAENMARDEALLRRVVAKESQPCVRFYQWEPAGLTLGRFQKVEEGVDIKACSEHGVDIVRRLTGGEAVLHDDELTYSIIIPFTHPGFDGRGVIDTYKTISKALIIGLDLTGVRSTIAGDAPTRSDPQGQGVCFYTPTVNEIIAGGRKIIGSAQTRDKLVILQHGSIPIDWDMEKQFDVMGIPDENRDVFTNLFKNRATTISEQLGSRPDIDVLSGNFTRGFEEVFNTAVEVSEYSLSEKKMTQWLVDKRYGSQEWNLKI